MSRFTAIMALILAAAGFTAAASWQAQAAGGEQTAGSRGAEYARLGVDTDASGQVFLKSSSLGEKLVPLGGSTAEEASEIRKFLAVYESAKRGVPPDEIWNWIRNHPGSAWNPSLYYCMGLALELGGRYADAAGAFSAANSGFRQYLRQNGGEFPEDARTYAGRIYDSIYASLLSLHARLGNADEVAKLLVHEDEHFSARAVKQAAWAKYRLWDIRNKPEKSFRSGTFALSKLLPEKYSDSIMSIDAPKNGFSLLELKNIAGKYNQKLVVIKDEKDIPVPSVAYLRSGHFAAITGTSQGRILKIEDAVAGFPRAVRENGLMHELTGYYLVAGNFKGGTAVPDSEAAGIRGLGYVPFE